MSGSVILWLAWALALFWATGAYNRLVRLRGQIIRAFAALDEQFLEALALVQRNFVASQNEVHGLVDGLIGAAAQLDGSLKARRGHPLSALHMQALAAAYEVLLLSWRRLCEDPGDLAGAPLPEALLTQWQHAMINVERSRAEFNQRVHTYNHAIAQFPARLLAWALGFKPAHPF
jgi:LemA protein